MLYSFDFFVAAAVEWVRYCCMNRAQDKLAEVVKKVFEWFVRKGKKMVEKRMDKV